jgi:hypothetical protein
MTMRQIKSEISKKTGKIFITKSGRNGNLGFSDFPQKFPGFRARD